MKTLYCLFLFFVTCQCFSQTREIAITIDDLPLVASRMNTPENEQQATKNFRRIIESLTKYEVPATGFVIAGAIAKGQWAFLEEFRDAGFMIANHSYSHYNLNSMSAEKYIKDVARADKILSPLLTEPKYFRYPFLAEGSRKTKPQVLEYLKANQYIIAPITIDSKDFRFNARLYRVASKDREAYIAKMKPQYLAFIWRETLRAEKRGENQSGKQILLIHANLLNSYLLEDVLQMFKENGYKFISLTEALENPAQPITYPATEKDGEW